MSVQDYMSALKLGKREYNACVNKGKYPYLPVMESMMDEEQIDSEVSLGIDQIPLRLVVGTCTAGRTNAFADNSRVAHSSRAPAVCHQYAHAGGYRRARSA